jgi:hypothetical protein
MKNKLLLFALSLLLVSTSFGQSVIFEESFDGFSAGDKLVQTINNQELWDTWSSAPGGSEDAVISNTYASSPENSLYLASNNDIVLLLGGLTEGRYKMAFKALISSGNIGYFNMLHDFAGGDSQWAFQVYFNANGVGSVDAAKTGAASFTYEYDTWMDVEVIIDLDDDFATFYLGGEEVVSWKWSLGTSGGGTLTRLDAVNFYGIAQGGSSGMYVDDVVFTEESVPEAPLNLKAEVEDESMVNLTWDAPANTPDNYVLSRNNSIIAKDLTETYFSESPYPGDNIYSVRAHTIGLGYSHGSEEVTAFIPGGLDREYVLFEIGTGTGCPYCPGASMGAVDMVENGDNVIIVKYHNFNASDPFNNPASAERASTYYQITGYPTSFADGTLSAVGGSSTQSLFESYHQHYLQRKERKALYTLDVNVFHLSGNDYRAEISVEQHSGYNAEQKTLHTALTESDIDYAWQNQSQVHWACRNMFPDALGTAVDFSEENTQSMNIDFSLEDDYVKENCEFVVFLQADPSKEVMVTTKVDMADIVLKTLSIVEEELDVFPNPSSDFLHFNKKRNLDYTLLDVRGKTVLTGKTTQSIDIRNLDSGIYFLNIEGQKMKKVIVQ